MIDKPLGGFLGPWKIATFEQMLLAIIDYL